MKSKAWTEKFMQGVFFIAACASVLAVALICIFLFANGVPAIREIGFVKFITGEEPIENHARFVETLNSMGLERLTELYQAAYERYLQNG